jgi:hypothetical protein
MAIDTKNESSPANLLAVAEWNPTERIRRVRSLFEIEYPPASRGRDKPAFVPPFAVVVQPRVMLSVTLLVNLDGFNSAFRSEHRVVLIDFGAFANRSLTAERRFSCDCPKTIGASTWNHSLPMFIRDGIKQIGWLRVRGLH